jgi:hypothetical protein
MSVIIAGFIIDMLYKASLAGLAAALDSSPSSCSQKYLDIFKKKIEAIFHYDLLILKAVSGNNPEKVFRVEAFLIMFLLKIQK